jgi:L-asparaginase / beta-aspartyl-peptidase
VASGKDRFALVAHGGAGAPGPAAERPERRRGMVAALRLGGLVLRRGGTALEAVVATVAALEDHPLFNAGYGSLLNSEGSVEMDASLMVAEPVDEPLDSRAHRNHRHEPEYRVSAGAVAAVSRVRNPILLARAVMERSPHILMVGAGAERFARGAGIAMVKPDEMISERARERWRIRQAQRLAEADRADSHGTVGAVAIDVRGALAAATSTGGVPGKLYGRVGDSAIIGAGTFAHKFGAASATGQGEAIIVTALCREATMAMAEATPQRVAQEAIEELIDSTSAEAGIILIDRKARMGYAHNAATMQVGTYDSAHGLQHVWLEPITKHRHS